MVNDGSEVQVLDDAQLNCPVIELLGPRGGLTFACNVPHRYLGIHMRHLHKFLTIEVDVVDSSKKYRKFHLSTRRSIATVTDEVGEMPTTTTSTTITTTGTSTITTATTTKPTSKTSRLSAWHHDSPTPSQPTPGV